MSLMISERISDIVSMKTSILHGFLIYFVCSVSVPISYSVPVIVRTMINYAEIPFNIE